MGEVTTNKTPTDNTPPTDNTKTNQKANGDDVAQQANEDKQEMYFQRTQRAQLFAAMMENKRTMASIAQKSIIAALRDAKSAAS